MTRCDHGAMLCLWVWCVALAACTPSTPSKDSASHATEEAEDDSGTVVRQAIVGGAAVGTVLATLTLDANVRRVRGITFDDSLGRLYVLDEESTSSYRVETYQTSTTPSLTYLAAESFAVPAVGGAAFAFGRGLAFALEDGETVLYSLASDDNDGDGKFKSRLWRITLANLRALKADLNAPVFDLRDAEAYGLAAVAGNLFVTFNASQGLELPNTTAGDAERVRRGILRFRVNGTCEAGAVWRYQELNCFLSWAIEGNSALEPVMLPDSGRIVYSDGARKHYASYGAAIFPFPTDDGNKNYLFATSQEAIPASSASVSKQRIYAAETDTGRALFSFALPRVNELSDDGKDVIRYLGYGLGVLWAAAGDPASVPPWNELVGIEVLNTWQPDQGTRHYRRLEMSLQAKSAETGCKGRCGSIRHYYGRPHGLAKRLHQDVDLESERVGFELYDKDDVRLPAILSLPVISRRTYDPMGDAAQRQVYQDVFWALTNESYQYRSIYQINLWHSIRNPFIYPHFVADNATYRAPFIGTSLEDSPPADDAFLYDIVGHGPEYEAMVLRITDYIAAKYGATPDMSNPFWIARNVLEYISDHYSYPSGDIEVSTDTSLGNYAGGPAWWKVVASASPWLSEAAPNQAMDNVNMCVTHAILFAGVMRHLNIPTRWVGTLQEVGYADSTSGTALPVWAANRFEDVNANGVFDGSDYQVLQHGHMTAEVYLGSLYGWVRMERSGGVPGDLDGDGVSNQLGDYTFVDPVAEWTNRPRGQIELIDWFKQDHALGPDENAIYVTMGIDQAEPFAKAHDQGYNLNSALSPDWDETLPMGAVFTDNGHTRARTIPALGLTVRVGPVIGNNRNVTFTTGDLDQWLRLASDARLEIVEYDMGSGADPVPINMVTLARGIVWDTTDGITSVMIANALFVPGWHRLMARIEGDPMVGGATGPMPF